VAVDHAISGSAVNPDQLIEALVIIIEESAPRRYHRDTGAIEPLTAAEIDTISDRILALCAKNRPREPKPVLDSRAGGDERK
jgi:hypothetical protein